MTTTVKFDLDAIVGMPLEEELVTKTSKVAPAAWERVKEVADRLGVRMSDVISASLLYMPEDFLIEILARQKATLEAMPKSARALLRHAGDLDEATRKMLIEQLSKPAK